MNDDVCSERKRTAERGGGKRVVHDEQNPVFFTDRGDFVKIKDGNRRICDGLRKDKFRLFVDERIDLLSGRVHIKKSRFDPELGQSGGEEIECPAVNFPRGDNIVSFLAQGHCSQEQSGHSRCTADTCGAALQSGDLFFECIHGRIGETGVEKSFALQIKQICHDLRIAVEKRRALHDGRDAALARLGLIACLYTECFDMVLHSHLLRNSFL